MNQRPRIAIIGATSSMAEHCARLWTARQPAEFVLVARNQLKMDAIAADLAVRSPQTRISTHVVDFSDPAAIQSLADALCAQQPPDIVLIAHGSLPDQKDCQDDLASNNEALVINGTSPVLFAEAFAGPMQKANAGTIAVIGSVAGDRGRKSNYVYGAAKGMVTRYVQGLQHRLAMTNVRVVLVKPGPTDTPMTAELKQKGARLTPVESVAADIVRGVDRGTRTVYAPGKWALIMLVIRHLPHFVFKRMDI